MCLFTTVVNIELAISKILGNQILSILCSVNGTFVKNIWHSCHLGLLSNIKQLQCLLI